MISDPLVTPLMLELLECLQQEMAKVEYPPARVGVRPGNVVDHLLSTTEDECCNGLAWVRTSAFYPSSDLFPQQDEAPLAKGVAGWAVTFEMGAIRCAPTPEPDAIPSEEEWLATVIKINDDAAAMRRAICCFIDAAPANRSRVRNVIPGLWTPLDVEGGCLGGTLAVTVRGPACDCPDAGPES